MQTNRFETHPQQRIPFTFADSSASTDAVAAKADVATRQARATEYIAMFLDRIEIHLDRIATACEQGTASEKLRMELTTIVELLRRQARP